MRRAEKQFEAGKFQDCLRECEQAVLSDPDNFRAGVLSNEVYYILALESLKQYPRRLEQMDGMLNLGRWYFLKGYSYQAEDQARRVLELVPELPKHTDSDSRAVQARELLTWIQRERDRGRGITDD
ncbi:MAG: hypothetical protein HY293_07010 [Planctomycetes bacterium]|nr:hypothetical protein [Planctomycetota bacterium]